MRRVVFLAAGLAIAAATTMFGTNQLGGGAAPGTPAAVEGSFVGAWRLTFDTPTGPSQSLLTVMGDGTLLFSGRPVSPAAGGFPVIFSSTAHGAWEQSGPTSAALTWVGLVADGEGTLLAVVTDSVEATLSVNSNAWSGSYSATVNDPDGNELYVGGATVRAERITVQPLATPAAATPAAG
jgi:hypothetical protein